MITTSAPIAEVLAGRALWNITRGDALKLLAELPAGSVDAAFVDPPYFLSNGGFTCKGGKRVPVAKGEWDVSQGVDADLAFTTAWLAALQRVLKPTGSLWVSGTQHVIFLVGFAMQRLGFKLLNTVTWYKPNAAPNLACRYFTHSTELLIWASPRQTKGPLRHTFAYAEMKAANGGKQMRDVWALPRAGEEELSADGQGRVWSLLSPRKAEKALGHHPTQKPLALLERVISSSTTPGAVVLDPFSGSGTTGVAAVKLGRRFVGFDLDEGYCSLSRARIKAERIQLPAPRPRARRTPEVQTVGPAARTRAQATAKGAQVVISTAAGEAVRLTPRRARALTLELHQAAKLARRMRRAAPPTPAARATVQYQLLSYRPAPDREPATVIALRIQRLQEVEEPTREAESELVAALYPMLAREAVRRPGALAAMREDLVQVGAIAALREAPRYRPEVGMSFARWVRRYARRDMARYQLRHAQDVHLSDHAHQFTRVRTGNAHFGPAGAPAPAVVEAIRTAPRAAVGLEDAPELPAVAPNPEEEVAQRERLEGLQRGLASLPERSRVCLMRHHGIGTAPQTYEQIAAALGISFHDVRAAITKGLRLLRARLPGDEEGEPCP